MENKIMLVLIIELILLILKFKLQLPILLKLMRNLWQVGQHLIRLEVTMDEMMD